MSNKLVFTLGMLGVLASAASASMTTVWSAADGKGEVPPYGSWFYYKSGTGAKADSSVVNDAKVLTATVSKTAETSAGYGFAWAAKDAPISLAAYKGLCVTYSSTYPFRVDMKQSTIKDYNYNGAILPAHSKLDTAFVAFADLKQEDWGDDLVEVAFDATKQTGVQFSYKKSFTTDYGLTNKITISAISLGSSCTNHAPVLTTGFAGYDGGSLELQEGTTHEIVLADVFEDEDGDDLKITVKIDGESVVMTEKETSFSLKDVIHFETVSNPKTNSDVVITAADGMGKTATFSFTFETKDVDNLPVAKNTSFEVLEDSVLRVSLTSRLALAGSDPDGDDVTFVFVEGTKNGELDMDEEYGKFTYTPNKNFFGYDTITYKFVETERPERESELAYAVIKVVNVNDSPVVNVLSKAFLVDETEYAFGDTIVVDEDFEDFDIMIPAENLEISDPDGEDDYKISASASGVVTATYVPVTGLHGISIVAKKDLNGLAKVQLVVADSKVSVSNVVAYIKVNPVADVPSAVDDSYDVYQDSVNTVTAKKGVLANDLNPDGDTTWAAVLLDEAEHGKVTLNKDGSFTYEADAEYKGEDAFAYKVVIGDVESKMAVVTLNVLYKNRAPQVVAGVADTVGNRLDSLTEDFLGYKKYTAAEVLTWFKDDVDTVTALKFSVSTKDSLLAPSITPANEIQIRPVKNACGDAEVIVTATDKQGASSSLKIPASISCINDKPVLVEPETLYVAVAGWTRTIDLSKYVSDPDGDVLEYAITSNKYIDENLSWSLDSAKLTFAVLPEVALEEGKVISFKVKASDSLTYVNFFVIAIVNSQLAPLPAVVAAPKMNWTTAVQAPAGVAALFDMQGRVMWKRSLPVSADEVRAAAASVQGRKILRVNKQTWTVK